jgi:septum formation protein
VQPPDIDETPLKAELPRPYCLRIAREKAEAIAAGPEDIVLCADTTVAMGRRIMGKPADEDEARGFLSALSGRRHRVYTAVAVRRGARTWERVVESRVRMKRLSHEEIAGYLATGDWRGKAGGYSIQGPAGAFIPWISGSHSAIVGLPLAETASLLAAAGRPVWRAA